MKVKIKNFEFDSKDLVSFSYENRTKDGFKEKFFDIITLSFTDDYLISFKLRYSQEKKIYYSKSEYNSWIKDVEALRKALEGKNKN